MTVPATTNEDPSPSPPYASGIESLGCDVLAVAKVPEVVLPLSSVEPLTGGWLLSCSSASSSDSGTGSVVGSAVGEVFSGELLFD